MISDDDLLTSFGKKSVIKILISSCFLFFQEQYDYLYKALVSLKNYISDDSPIR